jgi:hypothetical protein
MARELSVLQAAMSSVVESVLGHSPNVTFQVEVVGKLVAKFQGWRSCVQGLSGLTRGFVTCSLDHHLIGPDGPTVWMWPLDS